jgi:hypothetical protein
MLCFFAKKQGVKAILVLLSFQKSTHAYNVVVSQVPMRYQLS